MLEICGINKTFNPGTINVNHALKDLSLHLADGESIAVIGGNGAGKSTLLNAVAGTWNVDSGSIHLGGVDITHLPEYKRAKYTPWSKEGHHQSRTGTIPRDTPHLGFGA